MAVRHTYAWVKPGTSEAGTRTEMLTPLKAIRRQCAHCMGFDTNWQKAVAECLSPQCSLYPYRFGKDPSLKGVRRGCSRARSGQNSTNDTQPMPEQGGEEAKASAPAID